MLGRLRHCVLAFGLFLALSGLSSNADSATFEAGGLSFSDELGGFRLISASGQGTPADPIVLIEELTSLNPAVLTIRQAGSSTARSPAQSVLLRSLVKVVINRSAWRWSGFDLELRGAGGRASIYTDGLSFDQLRMVRQPLSSDQFAEIRTQDEPFDRLQFDHGRVEPDQTVRLGFNIVDINPHAIFYLAQEPIVLMAEREDAPVSQHFVYAAYAFGP
ncbi:MAG: hypothetical protein ACRBM6_12590 [Geminicoccales bacterium]